MKNQPSSWQALVNFSKKSQYCTCASSLQANLAGYQADPHDLLAAANCHNPLGEHQALLISNFLAQTEDLMNGKTADEDREELGTQGYRGEQPE